MVHQHTCFKLLLRIVWVYTDQGWLTLSVSLSCQFCWTITPSSFISLHMDWWHHAIPSTAPPKFVLISSNYWKHLYGCAWLLNALQVIGLVSSCVKYNTYFLWRLVSGNAGNAWHLFSSCTIDLSHSGHVLGWILLFTPVPFLLQELCRKKSAQA